MKRILTVFFGLLVGLCVFAQSPFSFQGIAIEGNLSQFVGQLDKQGFTVVSTPDQETCVLQGKFDERTCTATVKAHQGEVSQITLTFPAIVCWKSVHYEYVHYQHYFTELYGKPTQTRNLVEKDYRNGMEFWGLSCKAVEYFSLYDTPEGKIKLYITTDNGYDGYVNIEFLPTKK